MKVKLAGVNIKSHGYIRGFRIFYCVYYQLFRTEQNQAYYNCESIIDIIYDYLPTW